MKFDQHLYAQTITDRFEINKTTMVPATAAVKPLSKEDGPQTAEEREEMHGIPYREAVERSCGHRP